MNEEVLQEDNDMKSGKRQQGEMIKKKETAILELKSTIIELKNSLEELNLELDASEERLVNSKTGYSK